jgi:hypothetical protein
MDQKAAILAYYDSFRTRDRGALERLLVPDFRHRSPFGEYDDRDRMLDEIWPAVGGSWAIDIEIYGEGPDFMVRYRHNVEGSGTMAEYVRFEGGRIAEIEVYLGSLPQRP